MKKVKKKFVALAVSISTVSAISATSLYLVNQDQHFEKKDNGFYTMYGGERGQFDKEKTPVTNMLILLKILDGSNLCDNDWFKELRDYESMVKKQCVDNKKTKDKEIKILLSKQENILNALKPISSLGQGKKASDKDIEKLRNAYKDYHDYYYSIYEKGAN